jgi:SpoIIAA-like
MKKSIPLPFRRIPMTDAIELVATDNLLEVRLTGKLTKEFYEKLAPAVEKLIAEHGKLRILMIMQDFHGWTAGALWEDVKFEFKHWRDIEKLAMVGETKWENGMATFCKPFTKAKIRYFDHTQLEEARKWIAE